MSAMTTPLKDIIGIVTGVVGLAGAALAGIRYFTKKEQLEGDLKRSEERYNELDLRFKEAVEMIGKVKLFGSEALLLKAEVDNQLEAATKVLQARASSVLVPLPGKDAQNLIFLSAFGPAAPALRRTTVPLKRGIAAHVFVSSRPILHRIRAKTRSFTRGLMFSPLTLRLIFCASLSQWASP